MKKPTDPNRPCKLYIKLRTEDGATFESKEECSPRKAMAIHMLRMLGDNPPPLPEGATPEAIAMRAACAAFIEACDANRRSLNT